ncbi:MAG TPA: FAD-dependent oxidoreductase [Acidimicrobiia bacterium]|nr:FAD-dependent oxidoreductase [Acidimicrobiia bacterium]
MSKIAVLGSGIVGTAAAWDLTRRGHDVVVADSRPDASAAAARIADATPLTIDATDDAAVHHMLEAVDAVVSAVPYSLGVAVAKAAIATATHYFDFGGNPTIVGRQLLLDEAARRAGVAVVPDCGLAPGMANVLAAGAVGALGDGPIDEVRLRVGALPSSPSGTLGYQLAFNPAGLINEYAEPCEVLAGGRYATVEPLTGTEEVAWDRWGPLEAFHTAGGSSSLPRRWEGRVRELDYKTLRFPGHRVIFRGMLEVGLFDEVPQPETGTAPRAVLLEALRRHLPSGAPDIVLVRVWAAATRHGSLRTAGYQVEDHHDGRFSALARTTAFPTTALAHLVVTGAVGTRGACTMDGAVEASDMITALGGTGIVFSPYPA